MNKNQFLWALLYFVLFTSGCGLIEQNDFIKTEEIGIINHKKIVYSLYQTGIDNYRYDFLLVENRDTTKLVSAFLNDATADNSRFEIQKTKNKVNIKLNKPIGQQTKNIGDLTYLIEGNLN